MPYDDDNDDSAHIPESSDDYNRALNMDLNDLEVEDAYSDQEDEEDGSDGPTYIEFTDGKVDVTLTEAELGGLPDAFMRAWNDYCRAGSECAAEARAERQQLYGGSY